MALRLEGRRPGFGLFAIQAVTQGGHTVERIGVSDVTLYEVSEDGTTVTLYDGFIEEAGIEPDEAYIDEDRDTELALESEPIWDSTEEYA